MADNVTSRVFVSNPSIKIAYQYLLSGCLGRNCSRGWSGSEDILACEGASDCLMGGEAVEAAYDGSCERIRIADYRLDTALAQLK